MVLCSELFYPDIVQSRIPDDGVAIVQLANDSWIHGPGYESQLLASARYRAIETGLPVYRVAFGGPSFWVDARGALVGGIPRGASEAARVPLLERRQRLNRIHAVPALLLLVAVVCLTSYASSGPPSFAQPRQHHFTP